MDGSSTASAARYSDLSRDEIEAQITELAGQLNAANYRWLTLIAEVRSRPAERQARRSPHSCAHWLNFKVGLNMGSGARKGWVAHALAGVPKIAAAMARGELSYSKEVRCTTQCRDPRPPRTAYSPVIALHGTRTYARRDRCVRYFRRAQ